MNQIAIANLHLLHKLVEEVSKILTQLVNGIEQSVNSQYQIKRFKAFKFLIETEIYCRVHSVSSSV